MIITPLHRQKLKRYLAKFYSHYPSEQFTIFDFVKALRKRQANNKDAWIPVSGPTGTGKSYAVLQVQILHGSKMTLTDNVAYIPRGHEISEKFKKLKRQTLNIDESAKEMRKVNWQSREQQNINVAAMTERFQQNIVFMLIPDFNEMTRTMRLSNAMIRMVVLFRTDNYARVLVQMKSRNWRSEDPWGDVAANKKYERLEKRKVKPTNAIMLDIERSLPSHVMDFIVPNLELVLPDVTDEYQRLKQESRFEAEKIDQREKVKDKYRDKYDQLVLRMSHLLVNNELELGARRVSREQIASVLGISQPTLRKYLARDAKDEKKKKN